MSAEGSDPTKKRRDGKTGPRGSKPGPGRAPARPEKSPGRAPARPEKSPGDRRPQGEQPAPKVRKVGTHGHTTTEPPAPRRPHRRDRPATAPAAPGRPAGPPGKPARSDHAGKPARSDHAGKPARSDHAGKPARSDHAGGAARGDHAGKPAREHAGKPARDERGARPTPNEHAGKPARSDHAGKPARSDHAGKPARDERGARPAQAATSARPAESKGAGQRHPGGPAAPASEPKEPGKRHLGGPGGHKDAKTTKPVAPKAPPARVEVEEPKAPEKPSIPVKRAGYAAMVGRSNMGKSTLMNALLGEALAIVSPIPQTTRNRVLGVVRSGDAQIGLLDTPGLHKPKTRLGQMMNATARHAVDEADVVLFVTAPPSDPTGKALRVSAGDRTLLADIGKGKPTILVINKVDLIKPRSDVLPLIEEFSKIRDFVSIIPISARREDGLDRLLAEIAPYLPEREALWPDDELTDQPVRFFVGEFVREEILRMAREELPYVVAVTVDSYDESGRVPRIFASIHVEREGQKPIVIGHGGTMLRDIGTAARARVEDLLGQQVHLELHVRVTPGWSNDPKVLREFGYDEAKAP
jgi:GTP-binding protein Era